MPKTRDDNKVTIIDNNGEKNVLTIQEQIFVNEYLKTRNGTKSAIIAGYSEKSAGVIANELLKRPKVKNVVRFYSENIVHQIGIEQQQIAREYARIGFSDITNYLNDDYTLKDKEEISRNASRALKALKVRKKVTTLPDGSTTEESDYTIQVHDKLKALDRLAEMSGMISNEKEPVQVNNFVNTLTNIYK